MRILVCSIDAVHANRSQLMFACAVQMRIDGLLESGSWSFVEQLMAKECSTQSISAEQSAVVLAQELDQVLAQELDQVQPGLERVREFWCARPT